MFFHPGERNGGRVYQRTRETSENRRGLGGRHIDDPFVVFKKEVLD